jgi:hypothetical protein
MNATLVTADSFKSKRGQRSDIYIEEVKAKSEKQKQERGLFFDCGDCCSDSHENGDFIHCAEFKV